MTKSNKPDYLTKAMQLNKEETERLLSRMGAKLDRRLEKNKISQAEALAMQLELEDEQLQEWRKVMLSLKAKEEAREAKEDAKKAGKAKTSSKTKPSAKVKAPARVKATAKKTAAGKNKVKSS